EIENLLFVSGVVVVCASLFFARQSLVPASRLPPEGESAPPPIYLSPPEGYRRAQQAEVTPAMTAQARASLSSPMGSMLGPYRNEYGIQYFVGIETHSNKPKGAS